MSPVRLLAAGSVDLVSKVYCRYKVAGKKTAGTSLERLSGLAGIWDLDMKPFPVAGSRAGRDPKCAGDCSDGTRRELRGWQYIEETGGEGDLGWERGMIVTSALIIWKALMCITGSESPVVVVLSGSMEPGFKRGDILFLHMSKDPIRAGEIVVFNVDVSNAYQHLLFYLFSARVTLAFEGREIPIVHRVIKVHERKDTGEVDVLTKGDNNFGDDRLLYAQGQLWLQRHHIMGRAVGFLPYVGWVTIIMTEKPIIKESQEFEDQEIVQELNLRYNQERTRGIRRRRRRRRKRRNRRTEGGGGGGEKEGEGEGGGEEEVGGGGEGGGGGEKGGGERGGEGGGGRKKTKKIEFRKKKL
ncbi:Signal peptidase complex catalytic subunit SEC11C [Capsicum annuum]|nr:Signal peptidase complex catalytic subunit SEC11C [Capsicum annuum]